LRASSSTRSLSKGFSMKVKAPSLVASTAVATVPWPEMMITGSASCWPRMRLSASRPSMPGILMSRNTRSGVSRSMAAMPSCAVGASRHS
jgi:hypothetical protein